MNGETINMNTLKASGIAENALLLKVVNSSDFCDNSEYRKINQHITLNRLMFSAANVYCAAMLSGKSDTSDNTRNIHDKQYIISTSRSFTQITPASVWSEEVC